MRCRLWVALTAFVVSVLSAGAAEIVVSINESNTFQQMEGFGASLTDSSAWLIDQYLSGPARTHLLEALFSPTNGIGLSYLRQPMGASDFRLQDYTYDDMPEGQTDYSLSNFTIDYETNYIIPMLQEIALINTNLRIMGSPWSPPAWMKDSDDLYYGRLKSDCYDALARYFLKYVQAYTGHDLNVDAVTLQNEPLYEPHTYAGMRMDASNQVELARRVGQYFQSNAVATKILVYDHNWDRYDYPITVMNDATAKSYVAGAAFHGYGGDVAAQSLVHEAHPDRDLYFTEKSAGDWAGDFGEQLLGDASMLIVGATRYWAKTVIKWNLALDQNNGPKIMGGCETCHGVVTINTNTGVITTNSDYYVLGHASKFVRPGAYQVEAEESLDSGPYTVAFMNPDTSMVVVAVNADTAERNVVVRWRNQSFSYPQPARSVATFAWPDVNGATVEVWLTTADQAELLELQHDTPVFRPATITWKGYEWTVRDTAGNPGGNRWAADCVSLDASSNLHLQAKTMGDAWYCGEVDAVPSLSHGTYRWYAIGRPDLLDSNMVAGFSTYFDASHEINIELSAAMGEEPTNLFYTVQPYYLGGHRYEQAHNFTSEYTTHEFVWNPRTVRYRSWYGHSAEPPGAGAVIADWTYEGTDVPGDTGEVVRMNLWMFDAQAPPASQEWVLADFVYECSTGTLLRDDFEDASLGAMWTAYGESGGQATETGGDLRLAPGDANGASYGCRATNLVTWADDGLSYVFSAYLTTVNVTAARSAGGEDVWGYHALVSGSNGMFDPYNASNAAVLRAGYDASADALTVEFLTKTGVSGSWGSSRFVGSISGASTYFGGGQLELRFTLVYGDYRVEALYGGSPVVMTPVSGSSTGAHNLGSALYSCRYEAGAQNHDEGRGSAWWEEVHARAVVELESTAGGNGDGGPGAKVVQLGDADAGTTWKAPIDTSYTEHRSETLYKAEDIERAGTITQLLVYVLSAPDKTTTDYTIRMQHTALENVPASYVNSGWTTVYQQDTLIPSDTHGWYAFALNPAFTYNGVSNLLVDFVFDNSSSDNSPVPAASYTECSYTGCFVISSSRNEDPFGWTTGPRGKKFRYNGNRFIDLRLAFSNELPVPAATNLSFEDGPRGFLTNVPGWQVEGSEQSGYIKGGPALHGVNSLKLWRGPDNGDQRLFQYFDIVLTNEYTLAGYILSLGTEPFTGTNAYGALLLQWYGEGGLLRTDESAHFTEDDTVGVWHYFAVTGAPPSGTTSGRIVCALFSSYDQEGALYFDKLSLPYEAAPPPAGSNTPPVERTFFLVDEFNDTTRSNIWDLTGDIGSAEYQEAGGCLRVNAGTNWANQQSGYITAQPLGWDNTSRWFVFSAVLSTIRVDSVHGGYDTEFRLSLCSEKDNAWYVTNSASIWGRYDKDADELLLRFLTKTDTAQDDGTERFNATVTNASRYWGGTNHMRMSIALGLNLYDVKFSTSAGLPLPVTVNSGSAHGPHLLANKLCSAYWMVGAQNNETNRGSVFWDRTEVSDDEAPSAALPAASQTSTDGSGIVTITARVADVNGDYCRLRVQASTNDGAAWFTPYFSGVTSSLAASVPGDRSAVQVVDIATTNGAGYLATNVLLLTWDTRYGGDGHDFSNRVADGVLVRVEPDDGDVSGAIVTGVSFQVDNQGPWAGGAGVSVEGGAAWTFNTSLAAAWSNFSDGGAGIQGYYYDLSDGGGSTDGAWTAATTGLAAGAVADATNAVYVWARDARGNIGGAAADEIIVLGAAGDWDVDGLANGDEGGYGADPLDADSDDDEMTDGWEAGYGLDPTNSGDATIDLDQDGYDNRHEFYFNTHPSNATSTLEFAANVRASNATYLVQWKGATARVYCLHWKDDLFAAWQPLAGCTNMEGVAGTMCYTGDVESLDRRFYKLRAFLP